MRINKFIAQSGIASRRKADDLIQKGLVLVNNTVVNKPGLVINPLKDKLTVDGKNIIFAQKVYYKLNKPIGYTSTTEDKYAKKLIIDLVPKDTPVFPVGRLDKNSRGLMILTNDGDFANRISHPRYEHEKEYELTCRIKSKKINQTIRRFEKGFTVKYDRFRPVRVKKTNIKGDLLYFNMILKEGKKRQIRRMCEAVGWRVLDLKRIRIGKLMLGDLKSGAYKKISKKEIL